MDVFDDDILDFWKKLNKYNVRYIMVGGFATNLHGFQSVTPVMEILLDDTVENRRLFRMAFKEYSSTDYSMIETIQFVPGWSAFNLNNGFSLDILIMPLKGLEKYSFNDCFSKASIAEIYAEKIPFLHINQLIANKRAVNRPKDQIDVIELEKIIRLSKEQD